MKHGARNVPENYLVRHSQTIFRNGGCLIVGGHELVQDDKTHSKMLAAKDNLVTKCISKEFRSGGIFLLNFFNDHVGD